MADVGNAVLDSLIEVHGVLLEEVDRVGLDLEGMVEASLEGGEGVEVVGKDWQKVETKLENEPSTSTTKLLVSLRSPTL